MPKIFLALVVLTFFTPALIAQAPQNPPAKTAQPQSPGAPAEPAKPAESSNVTSTKGFVLEEGTPVKLKINRTISSADAQVGDTVDFEVLEDVVVNGVLIAPKGGLAFATVTEAQAKRRMARGGKLDINIDYLRLLDSEKAALRAVKEVKGGGHTGAMTGGIVATSIVFFPAAPFFLFMHGKDISIPKGTEITAYVSGDMKLDLPKFQQATAAPSSSPSIPATAQDQSSGAQLEVSSTPGGADIEIDGNFVGSTPSTLGVTAGSHDILIKKNGFKSWTKKVAISNGRVKIDATLEAESN
jgi:hypothetical protein